jgi:hypothetical protein
MDGIPGIVQDLGHKKGHKEHARGYNKHGLGSASALKYEQSDQR